MIESIQVNYIRDATMDHQTACSHCGEVIDAKSNFCRHCGSSEADGWSDDDEGILDDDGFDYDEFVRDQMSDTLTNTQTHSMWRLVAIILLVLIALGYILI